MNKLAAASPSDILWGGLIGIEKESLRVQPDGYLSDRPHPESLGSALTNRFITTEMKTIYRNGLGYRYGRTMQTIAGVHFNYSLPTTFWPIYKELEQNRSAEDEEEFRSDAYLGLVRNFRRFGWLVLYLFGASPAVCKSFGTGAGPEMESLNDETLYEPFGTSLRMSDLGYSSHTQARLDISLNNLDDYISDLDKAMMTPEPLYQAIGLKEDGEYRQLSVGWLFPVNDRPLRSRAVVSNMSRSDHWTSIFSIRSVSIKMLCASWRRSLYTAC
jgi:gamma-glutamylcysteine synthetase